MKRYEIQEHLVYLVIWGMLFLTPIISLLIRMTADTSQQFEWQEVTASWMLLLPFLLLFVLHNFLLAHLLVYRKKTWLYIGLTLALLCVFHLYECQKKPFHDNAFEMGMGPGGRPPGDMGPTGKHPDGKEPGGPPPSDGISHLSGHRPPEMAGDSMPHPPQPRPSQDKGPRPEIRPGHPPVLGIGGPIGVTIVVILMFGLNLGIKYYFKNRGDIKKMEDLQRAHLKQQLEYLKYQINPHFFMNTLNNIHALVDIDSEQAKETILELSKMMRYILYEGSKSQVPLQHEVSFLHHYIHLMRLRYSDKVRISIDIPSQMPDRQMPPMLLVTFVENSFKHGVSYQKESFIEISLRVLDDRLHFDCRNSKPDTKPTTVNEQGGVGLRNVRERLGLLFGSDYVLDIDDAPDVYHVVLEIPLSPPFNPPTEIS